jgi:hypothetical protein
MKYVQKRQIAKINLALITLIPTLIFLAFSHRATADDPGSCFMITTSGRIVGLGNLCSRINTPTSSNIDNNNSNQNHKQVFQVPIKRRLGRTPVIDVTFNDTKFFEMIVDTGAHATLITQKMASTLQLETTGSMVAQIADGTRVRFPTSKVGSIEVGGVVANNLEVAIASNGNIGLLGHDFFGNYDIKIREKVIEFHTR